MSSVEIHNESFGPSLFAVTRLRLLDVQIRVEQYIAKNLPVWWEQEVLEPTIRLARSRGLSQKFIDSLKIEKFSDLKLGLVSEPFYTRDGLALNKLLEFGWKQEGYDIYPMVAMALGPMDYPIPFLAHVKHPGFAGYHIFESVKNWGFLNKLAERVKKETEEYMRVTAFQ